MRGNLSATKQLLKWPGIDIEVKFLLYLALDVTTNNCKCEIRCLALDGFHINTVHKLSSKVKKSLGGAGIRLAAGWEARMLPLCHTATRGKAIFLWHSNWTDSWIIVLRTWVLLDRSLVVDLGSC